MDIWDLLKESLGSVDGEFEIDKNGKTTMKLRKRGKNDIRRDTRDSGGNTGGDRGN